jgi:hypothetical protein
MASNPGINGGGGIVPGVKVRRVGQGFPHHLGRVAEKPGEFQGSVSVFDLDLSGVFLISHRAVSL